MAQFHAQYTGGRGGNECHTQGSTGNTNARMLSNINTSIGAEKKVPKVRPGGQNATSRGFPHCLISLILLLHSPFIPEIIEYRLFSELLHSTPSLVLSDQTQLSGTQQV